MARTRSPRGSSLTGVGQWLGRIAQFFRLGSFGAAEPGTAQPARSELRTVDEIVDAMRVTRSLPTPQQGAKQAWSYVCVWTNPETGERAGRGVRHVIEADVGATYQAVAAEARRRTIEGPEAGVYIAQYANRGYRLQCFRVGDIIDIPTS